MNNDEEKLSDTEAEALMKRVDLLTSVAFDAMLGVTALLIGTLSRFREELGGLLLAVLCVSGVLVLRYVKGYVLREYKRTAFHYGQFRAWRAAMRLSEGRQHLAERLTDDYLDTDTHRHR